MKVWRSTKLRQWSRNCPQAVRFTEEGAPYDRSIFHTGVAGHAVLQVLGEATVDKGAMLDPDEMQEVAESACKTLMHTGRVFDSVPEPPMPPDQCVEGRDLAIRWALGSPPTPTGRYEVGLAMTEKGEPATYQTPDARYQAILDGLDVVEYEDEESAGIVAVVDEHKTAWPTDETELETIQSRGHAVLVWLHHPEADQIVQRVNNLRTLQTFERIVYPAQDGEMLEQWRRDLLTLCDAADRTREARPGAGCYGCNYALSCPESLAAALSDGAGIPSQFAASQARRDALFAVAKEAYPRDPVSVSGGTVGYHGTPARKVTKAAVEAVLVHWPDCAPGALLTAMKPGLSQLENIAKVLYPGKGGKDDREAFLAECTEPYIRKTFGVRKDP